VGRSAPDQRIRSRADYIDLGSENVTPPPAATPVCPPGTTCGPGGPSTTHLDYKAFAAYAVGYLPIPVPWVDVFAKAGVAHWTLSGSAPPAISLSDNSSQFAWGAGGQVHMGDFGARLEYEAFSIRGTSGATLVSLSVFLNLL
jgi:hypothetical protein